MLLLGIDEAGRGPVIGPMVIAGFLIKNKKVKRLLELGVTDSKLLSPNERESLYPELKKIADKVIIKKISPQTIDHYVYQGKLNYLELKVMGEIINNLDPDLVFIDAPSRNIERVFNILKSFLDKDINIICKNKADLIYPVVSSASIIAKVERDREIRKIEEKLGFILGSGYPSDPLTKKALKEHYNELQNYIRKSWKTVRTSKQRTLNDFLK